MPELDEGCLVELTVAFILVVILSISFGIIGILLIICIAGLISLIKLGLENPKQTLTIIGIIGLFIGVFFLVQYQKHAAIETQRELAALTPQPTPFPLDRTGTITVSYINLRSGPGSTFEILKNPNEGEKVIVIGRSEDGLWLKVKYYDSTGWVGSEFVEVGSPILSYPVVN
jgi:hypothetical protein